MLDGGIRTDIQDACSVAQLVETEQPVIVHFGEDFKQQRADQRRDICNLISHLSTAAEVYLVPTTLRLERWIAYEHDVDLPGSLTDQCNTGLNEPAAKSEAVQNAIERFDIDGGIIELLRSVADTTTETRTLDGLEDELNVDRDTIHNRLHHLREYDLITETLSTADGSAVSLTSTGRAYLDAVYESAGVQATLEESLIAGGKSANNMPCNPACPREGGGGWTRNRLPHLHDIRQIPRQRLHTTTATTDDTEISVVDTNVDTLHDRAAPGIHYDHDDRTLLVSAEYDNPMSYMVCIARALSSEQIWSWLLTEDKLKDADSAKFLEFFFEYKELLRQLRCLGYLPDRIENIDEFRDLILDGRDELLENTKRLTKQDYPEQQDRSDFRSSILSDAQGLAGTMAHILDLVDVEIIREVRVPRYREFSPQKKQGLVKTIGVAASIQSAYGEATSYRQLYEHRDDKRKQAIEPTVDANDPYADLIGSFAIVGDFGSQKVEFVDSLNSELLQPQPPHQDAPEFQINVSVKGNLSRSDYALTVNALCKEKNLKPTPQAISTIAGICNSPYEVATALNYLQPNDDRRSIDSREVRFALAQLGPDDILRGATSTPRKAIIALLNATEPLSQSELADRADVSARSLRNHLDDLLDLGLIDETPTGYRFELSFNTDEERTDDHYPMYVADPDLRPDIHKAAKAIKTGHEHHFGTPIRDAEFPTWAGQQACADLREIGNPELWIRDVLPLLWGLACRDTYCTDEKIAPLLSDSDSVEVRLGPEIPQQRLAKYSGQGTAG
jgi:DNA-binding MarR family transcriptional regulator